MLGTRAFTVIELLVTIAIIGFLATVVISSVNKVRLKGHVVSTVAQVKEIQKAVLMYIADTGQLPPDCRLDCTETTDPLLNNADGSHGWSGPYISDGIYRRSHYWGGHIGIYTTDFDGNGKREVWIILDDDAPGTNPSDNSGAIPLKAMLMIDEIIDDGDLNNGALLRGNGDSSFALGEVAWRVSGSEE